MHKLELIDLSYEQQQQYFEFKKWVRQKYETEYEENLLLRTLLAKKFNMEISKKLFESIVKFQEEEKPEKITYEMVRSEYDSGMCYVIGNDRFGQPIILLRPRFCFPKKTTEERMKRFSIYIMEEAIRRMPPDVDRYHILVDFQDAGLANFNMAQMKQLAPVFQDCYPDRVRSMLVINSNWVLRFVWTILSAILDPLTVAKVRFLDSKETTQELLKLISEETLPVDYGGKANLPQSSNKQNTTLYEQF